MQEPQGSQNSIGLVRSDAAVGPINVMPLPHIALRNRAPTDRGSTGKAMKSIPARRRSKCARRLLTVNSWCSAHGQTGRPPSTIVRTPHTLTKGSSAPHADADKFVLMEASDILTAVYAHRSTRRTTLVMQLAQSTTKRLLRPAQATKTRNAWHIFTHQYCTLQTDTTSLLVPDYYHIHTYSITHTHALYIQYQHILHTHT